MIRAAVPADADRLIAFFAGREEAGMFPLAALHGGRLRGPGEELGDLHEMRAWVVEDGREVTGLLGLSGGGHLFPMWPGARWTEMRAPLAGQQVAAAIGPDGQAAAVLAGLGLEAAPRRHAAEEPGFALDLRALRLPEVAGFALRPLREADRGLLVDWRAGYLAELFAMGAEAAEARAVLDIDRWLAAGSHRILWRGGEAVALSGFNARIPGVVQVGGVYVPPGLRGHGLARRVVGLHLAEAREAGVARAVLFAASDAAASAYRALGFLRRGTMGIVELAAPVEVGA